MKTQVLVLSTESNYSINGCSRHQICIKKKKNPLLSPRLGDLGQFIFFLRHVNYLDFDVLDLVPEHVCIGSERVQPVHVVHSFSPPGHGIISENPEWFGLEGPQNSSYSTILPWVRFPGVKQFLKG